MSVFSYLDYRESLRDTALLWKKQAAGRSLQRLAESSGLHTPHLSNVTKGKAHLSQDQLYGICKALSLSEAEHTYLSLLLEWERSGIASRKIFLKNSIDEIRKEKFKSENHLKAKKIKEDQKKYDRIYLNPELYLTYFFLGVERYRSNPEFILKSLNISREVLTAYINELIEMRLIVKDGGKILIGDQHFHLSQESDLCEPHQTLMHYLSVHHMSKLAKDDKYGFNVTFSANKNTKDAIHELFLDFIKKSEALVRDTENDDEVYQFNFQLFPWSNV
jgi:uncharacterized protein (TIGR02147 family)